MGKRNWCKFLYIWHFLKMPFPVISLFKSRAGTSELPLLFLSGSWEVGNALPSPGNRGVDVPPDFGPGVHKNDQTHRDRADVVAPSPVSCGVKQGPFLSSAPSPFFSQRFFLTWILKFFHAGAFWATLLNTNPRTNYCLIRIIAFKCQWALQFSAQREGGVVTTKLPPSPLCH